MDMPLYFWITAMKLNKLLFLLFTNPLSHTRSAYFSTKPHIFTWESSSLISMHMAFILSTTTVYFHFISAKFIYLFFFHIFFVRVTVVKIEVFMNLILKITS